MTDEIHRPESRDAVSSERQIGQNVVHECYQDNSTLADKQNDSNNPNLPKIEFHSGNEDFYSRIGILNPPREQGPEGDIPKSEGPKNDSPKDEVPKGETPKGDTKHGDSSPSSKLISKLGDISFTEREKASGELKKLGPAAMPDLLKATADENPEIAARARELVKGIIGEPMRDRIRGVQFELVQGDLPGKDAQERMKTIQKDFDKYDKDPQAKENRLRDLEQMKKEVGKDLTPEQNKRIDEQLYDLKNLDEVRRRLQDISQFADIRAEEEEDTRFGKWVEQLDLIFPPGLPQVKPGDIEPPLDAEKIEK